MELVKRVTENMTSEASPQDLIEVGKGHASF